MAINDITTKRRSNNFIHGKSNSPTHKSWMSMNRRCNGDVGKDNKYYSEKGIKVCDRWKEFTKFLEDMGERPSNTSLDRIDPNKNYEPNNCRWATVKEQAQNKSSVRVVEFNGETKPLIEWARALGIKPPTLRRRLYLGWSLEQTLSTPTLKNGGWITGNR